MATSIATQNAFDRALDTYKKELNAKELRRITTPVSLDNVLATARDICEKHEKGDRRKTIRIFQQLDKARERLEPFNNVLTGLCKLPPYGGDLIWGSVSLTLQFVKDNHESFAAVLDYFTSIGKMMPLFDSLISTFDRSALVAPVGEALYIALIAFWVEAVKHYRVKGLRLVGRLVSSNVIKKKFEGLKQELEKQEQQLLKVSAAQHYADQDENAKQLQKLVQCMSLLGAVACHISLDKRFYRKRHILSSGADDFSRKDMSLKQVNVVIAPPRYSSDFNAAAKKRYGNTCQWILTKDEYKVWEAAETSTALIIYGQPGAGKTILSSYLISRMLLNPPTNGPEGAYICLYHYFKLNDETKNTPTAALRSMLHQLYIKFQETGGNPAFDEELVKRIPEGNTEFEDLWAVFVATITAQALKIIVILDAIDECKRSKEILRELRALATSQLIKVIITGREQGEHQSECAKIGVMIHITSSDVDEDIAAFVRYKISKIERLQSPRLLNIKDRVINDLSDKSNHKGMFLWAYLMCKDLKNMGNVAEIERLVDRLPRGIEDLYVNILKRLSHLPEEQRTFSRHVLEWIVVSNRPLKFLELEQGLKMGHPELIAMFEDDDEDTLAQVYPDHEESSTLRSGSGLIWSRKDIVRKCGSLVTYSGEADGDTIGLLHLTTKEFLSSPRGKGTISAVVETFIVDVAQSQITLSTACLELLNRHSLQRDPYFSSENGIQSTPHVPSNAFRRCFPLFEYATTYWPHYLLEGSASLGAGAEVEALMLKSKTLMESDFSIFWLEHFIRQLGPELALSTVNSLGCQFKDFDIGLSNQLYTAEQAIRSYMRVIARAPLALHLCLRSPNNHLPYLRRQQRIQELVFFSQVDDIASSRVFVGLSGWIHYEPHSDTLYMIESPSEKLHLKKKSLKSATAYQPAGEVSATSSEGNWKLKFATVSECGRYLAASFVTTSYFPSGVILTILWNIGKPLGLQVTADWAQPILVDRVEDPVRTHIFHRTGGFWPKESPTVSFGPNYTLSTPSGIWSIEQANLVARPPSIFEPTNDDGGAKITHTCFSYHAVARINGKFLEIFAFEEQGGSYELRLTNRENLSLYGPPERIGIRALSATGKKIVLGNNRTGFWCVIIRDKTADFVGLKADTESKLATSFQFTKTEKKLVATFYGCPASTVVIWSIIDDVGKPVHMEQLLLFKCHERLVRLSLIAASTEDEEGAIVVASNGDVHRLDFLTAWSEQQEAELLKYRRLLGCRVLHNGTHLRSIVASSTGTKQEAITAETWTLKCPPVRLYATKVVEKPRGFFNISPAGKYLLYTSYAGSITTEVFNCDGDISPTRVNLPVPPGTCQCLKFSEDDKLLACVISKGAHGLVTYTVHLLIAEASAEFVHVASYNLGAYESMGETDSCHIEITVSNQQVPIIAISTRFVKAQPAVLVLELVGDLLQVTASFDVDDMEMLYVDISSDGKWLRSAVARRTTGWPNFYPLPRRLSGDDEEREMLHPVDLKEEYEYIRGNDLFSLFNSSGIISFTHRTRTDTGVSYSRRVLGILPDRYLENYRQVKLIWPPADADDSEVKLLLLPHNYDRMAMIMTGIDSADLLTGEEWESFDPVNGPVANF